MLNSRPFHPAGLAATRLWFAIFSAAALIPLAGCARLHPQPASAEDRPLEGKAVVTSVKGQAEAVARPAGDEWQSLFDGTTLNGWTITDFAGGAPVEVEDGRILLHGGVMLTGITWTNPLPKTNYEVSLEAMKLQGSDFFCGLTMPVGESHCTFIVGGWGGGVVGISSIDGGDASENETTKFMNFDNNRWYRIRARVTPAKIETWIDDEQLVDQPIGDRRISMRPGEIELSAPFGIATWQTATALREIKIRRIDHP